MTGGRHGDPSAVARSAPGGALTAALLDLLVADDAALDVLADRLAPRLADRLEGRNGDEWLDSARAAAYLGLSRYALHRLTAARALPFHQDGPGARCWFRRSELDAWREQGRQEAR